MQNLTATRPRASTTRRLKQFRSGSGRSGGRWMASPVSGVIPAREKNHARRFRRCKNLADRVKTRHHPRYGGVASTSGATVPPGLVQLDAGRSFAEGARLLMAQHPDKAEMIEAYGARFDEMMPGPITGTVAILSELRERGTPLYALTISWPRPIRRPLRALTFSNGSAPSWFPARSRQSSPTPRFSTRFWTPTPSTHDARCSSTTCRLTQQRRRSAFTASVLRRPKRCATSLSGSRCPHSSKVGSAPKPVVAVAAIQRTVRPTAVCPDL